MFLSELNLTPDFSLTDFKVILNAIARVIYGAVNNFLKLFLHDITIFNIPVGIITLSVLLIFAIWHTLIDTLHSD